MSGGENKRFIEKKAAYLSDRFVVVDDLNTYVGQPKGIYDFDLQVDQSARMFNSAGKRVKVVKLRAMGKRGTATSGRTNFIRAFYLPYAKGKGFHHRLVDDVDFCFTDTMNGCTFVVGSGPQPLISHYNFANSDTQLIDQDRIDRHIGRRYKHGVTTLKKADYKDGIGMDQRCTMIGFRESGAWHFYYQRRADDLRYVPGKGSELVQIAADQSVKLT
jgi:hypothetical protein